MPTNDYYDYENTLNRNRYLTINDYKKYYGEENLNEVSYSIISIDSKQFDKFKYSNMIEISKYGIKKSFSSDLITEIMADKSLFQYLYNNLKSDRSIAFSIVRVDKHGKVIDKIELTRTDLKLMLDKVEIPEKTEKITYVNMMVNEDALKRKYNDEDIYKEYKISELINILYMPTDEFNNFKNNDEESIQKLYILSEFINEEGILDKYDIQQNTLNRLKGIGIELDFANNKKIITEFNMLDFDIINKIEENMDKQYNLLERIIYYYIQFDNYVIDKENINDKFMSYLSRKNIDSSLNEFNKVDIKSNISNLWIDLTVPSIEPVSKNEHVNQIFKSIFDKVKLDIKTAERNKIISEEFIRYYHPVIEANPNKVISQTLNTVVQNRLNAVEQKKLFDKLFADYPYINYWFLINSENQNFTIINLNLNDREAHYLISDKDSKIRLIEKDELLKLVSENNFTNILGSTEDDIESLKRMGR